jgi:hypothetical protein
MRFIAISVVVACTPAPPFHTFETAETLKAREVSMSVGGGAGGGRNGFCCGGGGARVRIGVGDEQEIGVDATYLDNGDEGILGGKLAYKRALDPSIALIAGVGGTRGALHCQQHVYGMCNSFGATAGIDAGLIASTRPAAYQLYGSLRLAGATQLQLDAMSETAIAALGVVNTDGPLRLMAELGGIAGFQHVFGDPLIRTTSDVEGFYFAVGLTYTWPR